MPVILFPLGGDCSPASVLKELGLRHFALPFDWVACSSRSLVPTLKDNFRLYHQQLRLDESRLRVVDAYGNQFPHDYPLDEQKLIANEWEQSKPIVWAKYQRRIERFLKYVSSFIPMIVLCRHHSNAEFHAVRQAFRECYQRDPIWINSVGQFREREPNVIYCHTEANGIYNETEVWKQALEEALAMVGVTWAEAMQPLESSLGPTACDASIGTIET